MKETSRIVSDNLYAEEYELIYTYKLNMKKL